MTRSHKIGWLVLAVALLFALWRLPRLHGQGFGSFSMDQPFLAKDEVAGGHLAPDQIPIMTAWWKASTLTNPGPVTNWVDVIGGMAATNYNASAWPSNHVNGVAFNGFDRNELLQFSYTFSNNYTLAIMFSCRRDNQNQALIGTDAASGFRLISGPPMSLDWDMSPTGVLYTRADSTLAKNTQYEVVVAVSAQSSNATVYVNGTAKTNVSNADFWNGKESFIYFGHGGSYWLAGWIREIKFYTNCLTAAHIQDLEYYRTNTYGP